MVDVARSVPVMLEHVHAIDAPMTDFDAWFDALESGLCTGCGRDAYAGRTGWWHTSGIRLCPDRDKPGRRVGFSADPTD